MRVRFAVRASGVVVLAGLLVAMGGPAPARAARPATAVATTVSVSTSGKDLGFIGDQYIGLSFEANASTGGVNSGRFDTAGNLAQLMRNLGVGLIRFGGNSVDRNYPGATAAALAGLARLVRATGWSVLYSEDLAQYNAVAVTRDASHVDAALGGYLAGFDCGNEPDLYHANGDRPPSYTESQYIAQDAACLQATTTFAPGVALAGPDTAGTSWLAAYGREPLIGIQWIDEHYYPMGCASGKTGAQQASILLSPAEAAAEAAVFTATRNAGTASHAWLRISETDSSSCDSSPGIGNAYATALWAIDYMLTGAEHGVYGMNFHTGLNVRCASYSPLCGTQVKDQYAAQATYYGLLFTHLLGSGQLLPVTVRSSLNVTAFALRPFPGSGLHLMVENLSGTATTAALRVGGSPRSAGVLRLTGPSLVATSGIEIQGATVAASGSFTPGRPGTVGCAAGTCPVTIAPDSAVIVSVG